MTSIIPFIHCLLRYFVFLALFFGLLLSLGCQSTELPKTPSTTTPITTIEPLKTIKKNPKHDEVLRQIKLLGYGVRQPGEQKFTPINEATIAMGTEFGLLYEIDTPYQIPLKQVTIYPESGIYHPQKGAIKIDEEDWWTSTGKQIFSLSYVIESDWELLPGRWILQIKSGDTVYLEKVFHLNE